MSVKFGLSLPQGWTVASLGQSDIKDPVEAYEAMTRVAQVADDVGFASAWLVDHFHTIPRPAQDVTFECWTTTAAIARDTRRIRIGQMVTCNGYRSPALLAKMAATVDALSHGRLNLGIGAGWYEHEYHAYGYEFLDNAAHLRQLREAVQIFLAMWTQDEATFEGEYYQVRAAINQPQGVQKPHIPLLIGGSGEKVTLKLVAQYADACNVGGDLKTIKQKFAVLKDHCEALGRAYESIHRTVSAICSIGETDEEARAKFPAAFLNSPVATGALIGSPDTLRQRFAELEDAGVQEVILSFPDTLQLNALRFFAQEFIG